MFKFGYISNSPLAAMHDAAKEASSAYGSANDLFYRLYGRDMPLTANEWETFENYLDLTAAERGEAIADRYTSLGVVAPGYAERRLNAHFDREAANLEELSRRRAHYKKALLVLKDRVQEVIGALYKESDELAKFINI